MRGKAFNYKANNLKNRTHIFMGRPLLSAGSIHALGQC